MIPGTLKAYVIGIAILVIGDGFWLIVLELHEATSNVFALVWWGSTAFAGFATAYLAPQQKIITASIMAMMAALLVAAMNLLYESSGRAVDFPGIRGAWIVAKIHFFWAFLLCLGGAAAAHFCARKRPHEKVQ
jgi:hypothetical protein